MSTISSSGPRSLGLAKAPTESGMYRPRPGMDGARGLAAMLLAAAVAALVVVADRLISTWADGHLLLAWVVLWAVIFAGTALLAGTARRLAKSAIASLDGWSRSVAARRAEARMWDIAKRDPRVMAELMQARQRDMADEGFEEALSPLGMEVASVRPVAKGWDAYIEQLAGSRTRNMHLYYI